MPLAATRLEEDLVLDAFCTGKTQTSAPLSTKKSKPLTLSRSRSEGLEEVEDEEDEEGEEDTWLMCVVEPGGAIAPRRESFPVASSSLKRSSSCTNPERRS